MCKSGEAAGSVVVKVLWHDVKFTNFFAIKTFTAAFAAAAALNLL